MTRTLAPATGNIDTPLLRSYLEACLQSTSPGGSPSVSHLERRPSSYATSHTIELLKVEMRDGRVQELLFKNLSRGALLEPAKKVKPAFLHHPLREIQVYRHLLDPQRFGTARCHGWLAHPRRGHYGLFLERVTGRELYQVGELATWEEVARRLAGLHRSLGKAWKKTGKAGHLLRFDEDYLGGWLTRARNFVEADQLAQVPAARSTWNRLAERYDRLIDRIRALPVTLIHGDFFASNVIVTEESGTLRVCPVDWEMAGIGPGLMDLAALISGKWTPQQKKRLALAYRESLPATREKLPSQQEFLAAVDCCCLALAVQWLGWAPEWVPPREHQQDWLAEALRLMEKLEL